MRHAADEKVCLFRANVIGVEEEWVSGIYWENEFGSEYEVYWDSYHDFDYLFCIVSLFTRQRLHIKTALQMHYF